MEPSPAPEHATIFRHIEEFSGLLAFAMTPSLGGRKLKGQFEIFNQDLKARAEGIETGHL